MIIHVIVKIVYSKMLIIYTALAVYFTVGQVATSHIYTGILLFRLTISK